MSEIRLPFFEVNFSNLDEYKVCLIVSGLFCISVITFNNAYGNDESGIIDKNSILYDFK